MLYLLYGPDTFRSTQRLREIREAFRKEHDPQGWNTVELDADGATVEQFRSALAQQGFLAAQRLVICRRFLGASVKKRRADQEETEPEEVSGELAQALGEATAHLKDEPGENVLLIWEVTLPNTKLARALVQRPHAYKFELLQPAELLEWLTVEATRRGGQAERSVLRLLLERSGTSNLWQISNDLDRLLALAYGRVAAKSDVEQLMSAPVDENIFHLVDAAGSADRRTALALLQHQLGDEDGLHKTIAMLLRQFRLLLIAKDFPGPAGKLAGETGVQPFVAHKLLDQSRAFNLERLKLIYRKLTDIDLASKSGGKAEVLLDLLITAM